MNKKSNSILYQAIRNALHEKSVRASITDSTKTLIDYCNAVGQGFDRRQSLEWEKSDMPRLLMLCVTELAEAMECHSKNLVDRHLPSRCGVEVQLADTVMRIFDMAGELGLDLPGALYDKMVYNANRIN